MGLSRAREGAGHEGLITCIVPTLNAARYLPDALESILAQTYDDTEVLVIDGGSTDETVTVALGYRDRVRLLRTEESGPSAARNVGVCSALGEFVAFFDADDLWHPQRLSRQMAPFRDRPELDCCFTHVTSFWDDDGGPLAARALAVAPVPGYTMGTMLARRSAFDKVGLLRADLRHADSLEWSLRARRCGIEVELLPDTLTYRRLHSASFSVRDAEGKRQEFLALMQGAVAEHRASKPAVPQ